MYRQYYMSKLPTKSKFIALKKFSADPSAFSRFKKL